VGIPACLHPLFLVLLTLNPIDCGVVGKLSLDAPLGHPHFLVSILDTENTWDYCRERTNRKILKDSNFQVSYLPWLNHNYIFLGEE